LKPNAVVVPARKSAYDAASNQAFPNPKLFVKKTEFRSRDGEYFSCRRPIRSAGVTVPVLQVDGSGSGKAGERILTAINATREYTSRLAASR